AQKKIEEEPKAEAARHEGEIRKEELIDLLGPDVVNRKDDTSEIIPKFKASDLHLGEWREVVKACTNKKAELGINLDRPLSEQDPLDKLNDLTNKKRKHADDIHDFFRANKRLKSSVQYEDHPAGIVLNEPVLAGYVTESDPEEDPEEYEDDETEDGPVDYPMDGGDDGDDDDGDSSGDDADDEDEDDEDEEGEEEEHLTPADSAIDIPVDEPVFPPEGTEPIIPPPSTDITIGARITVRPQASISLPPEAEVERLLAMTTPSPSPPISLSPPSAGERLARCTAPPAHSSPLPMPSPLLPSSGCPTQIQTLRIASTQALIDAVTAALPSPQPLPVSLYIPPPVDRKDDIPESEQPPHKRLYLSTLGSRYEVEESSTARPTRGRGIDYGFVSIVDAEERRQGIRDVGCGIRDTWVDPADAVLEIAPMTVREVNTRVTELAELHEHDIQDLYALLEDAQDSRSRISQ
ncbi:hypothetical protein Tco_1342643, partial [Tanacetum coccineum]